MKLLIAPDSYKNALSARQVAAALAAGWRQTSPTAEIIELPLADGGEGTLDAAGRIPGATRLELPATGPDGQKRDAAVLLLPDGVTALVELASCAGLELLTAERRNPLHTTTFGVGEQIASLLDRGYRKIMIGLGGSATVDGGVGLAQALGFRFYDRQNWLLPQPATGSMLGAIHRVDPSRRHPALENAELLIAGDVTAPLCGPEGAARLYGPQKGADNAAVEQLEKALHSYAALLVRQGLADRADAPGDGAAGGVGFTLRTLCRARSASGAELMLQLTDFDRYAAATDLVITGEGCSDRQTGHGKLPSVVAAHAAKFGKPTLLISGALKEPFNHTPAPFAGAFSISTGAEPLENALSNTAVNLTRLAASLAALTLIPANRSLPPDASAD